MPVRPSHEVKLHCCCASITCDVRMGGEETNPFFLLLSSNQSLEIWPAGGKQGHRLKSRSKCEANEMPSVNGAPELKMRCRCHIWCQHDIDISYLVYWILWQTILLFFFFLKKGPYKVLFAIMSLGKHTSHATSSLPAVCRPTVP